MKKTGIAAIIAAVSLIGVADANTEGLTGWYVGAQGGAQTTTANNFRADTSAAGVTASGSFDGGRTGGTIGAFAGYGRLCHKWYLAGQIEGSAGDYRVDTSGNIGGLSGTSKLKANSIWGIAALVGYEIVPNTVGYIRLGGDYSRLKLSNTAMGSKTKSSFGFAPGIGVRAQVAKDWFVNAEYKHSFFQKINLVNGSSSVSATPRLQTFTVGFAFKM